MKKIMNTNMIQWIVLTVIVVAGALYFTIKDNKERERINKYADYAIGEILNYQSSKNSLIVPGKVNSTGQGNYIKYEYKVKDSLFVHSYQSSTERIPDEGIEVGEKYLVIYNSANPQESRLLFDKKISGSGDFEKYMEELK